MEPPKRMRPIEVPDQEKAVTELLFEERQNFYTWVWGGTFVLAVAPVVAVVYMGYVPPAALLAMVAILLVALGCYPLITEVDRKSVRIRYGVIGLRHRCLAVDRIVSCEAMTISPLAKGAGIGMPRGYCRFNTYIIRGLGVVRLELQDGAVHIIGSQRHEELARVIEQARRA